MSFLRRIFGHEDDEGGAEPPKMPWDQHPSILEHLRSHIVEKLGLSEGGSSLPDDERINRESKIRWAPGAMDGVLTHHMGQGGNDKNVEKMVDLVVAYSQEPTVANKAAAYQHVMDANVVSVIDPVIEALVNDNRFDHDRLYELAFSFATEAPDREPVKFGVAILGLFRQSANEELFQTLGRHDEFTLYCAVALANSSDEHEKSLWTLAQNVDGWGRIHVVERLAQTEDAEIKRWLLREGFRNSVMYEYLAGTCARAGGLLSALSGDHTDRELLTSAGEIIQALIAGGPADSIDDYEDAVPVIRSLLRHLEASAETVPDYLHVNAICRFLDQHDEHWEARYQNGWSQELRNSLKDECAAILNRGEWRQRVEKALASQNEIAFFQADQAAKSLGIDTWDIHWQRLQAKPVDPGCWFRVMSLCNVERIGTVVSFAEQNLDLAQIATGPSDEMGLGPGFALHSCLDSVLQELRRFPGYGASLIQTGLSSPVVRNRNMALAALAEWPLDKRPADLQASLNAAIQIEPEDDVRQRLQKVSKGQPCND